MDCRLSSIHPLGFKYSYGAIIPIDIFDSDSFLYEGLSLVTNNIVSYNFLSSSNINILFGGVEGSPSSLTYLDPQEPGFYLSTSIT